MATVHIQKREDKSHNMRYYVRYKDPLTGKSKYYKSFRKKRDADDAANDLRALIDKGSMAEVNKRKKKQNLQKFHEVAEEVKKEWESRLEIGHPERIEENTVRDYLVWLSQVNRVYGKRLLAEIGTEEIKKYHRRWANEVSVYTANRRLFVIKQVMKSGLKEGAILEDPAAKIKYRPEDERELFLLPPEILRLVEASQQTRARHYMPALIWLGVEHGASKQESLSLELDHLNLEYQAIGLIKFFRTKNEVKRTEFMMPQTREALLHWLAHKERMRRRFGIGSIKSNRVFSRLDGTPIESFNNAWRHTRRLAGMEHLHYHDLRHTFASNLKLVGAGEKDVQQMIGHRDIRSTHRYMHIMASQKLVWQEKLSEHYATGANESDVVKG